MYLTTWTAPGSPFPDYAEHATEADAIAAAKRKSLELGVEVGRGAGAGSRHGRVRGGEQWRVN